MTNFANNHLKVSLFWHFVLKVILFVVRFHFSFTDPIISFRITCLIAECSLSLTAMH